MIARRRTAHGSGLGRIRWPVERTIAWLHQFRRLVVRFERRAEMDTGTTPPAQDDNVAPPVDEEELDEGLRSLALVVVAFVGAIAFLEIVRWGAQAPRAEARHAPSLAHGAGGGTGGPRLAPALAPAPRDEAAFDLSVRSRLARA